MYEVCEMEISVIVVVPDWPFDPMSLASGGTGAGCPHGIWLASHRYTQFWLALGVLAGRVLYESAAKSPPKSLMPRTVCDSCGVPRATAKPATLAARRARRTMNLRLLC